MIRAILAQESARPLPIPWGVVPMVFLGLIAVAALFGAIYWLIGKIGME